MWLIFLFWVLQLCVASAQPYEIADCINNSVDILENGRTRINCTGLKKPKDIYWSISFENRTEERIADCHQCPNNDNPCECTITNGDYNVTRDDTFSVLRLVKGDDRQRDGATITCSQRDKSSMVNCTLHVQTYKMPQCEGGHLNLSDVLPLTPIRCEDVDPGHRVSWKITDTAGKVMTVATCEKKSNNYTCTMYSSEEFNVTKDEFSVTRNDTFSELMIKRKIKAKENGTLITCMRRDGAAAVNCSLRVVPHQYNLPQCVNNEVSVSGIAPWTTIRCEDLLQSHVINWTVTDPQGNQSTVATCDRKANRFNCTTRNHDYNVSRINGSVSELMIVKEVREKTGSNVRCMRDNGKFAVSCNLHVIPHQYNLPQCQDGQLYVSDFVPWTPIRCENLIQSHVINWTITDPHGTTSTVATCDKGSGRFKCTTHDNDYNASRINGSVSELMIVKEVREKAGSNVTCIRDNDNVAVSCRLHVFPEADGNQDMQLFATVGGVLGAVVLIIVVVVVIVVITRRQKEGPRRPRKNFPENVDASFDDSNTEGYSRICDIVGDNAHNVMSVDNPCFIGTTASSVPMQLSTVSASALARNGNETQDLDEHTYTEVDLADDVWKKGSGGPAENTGRVVILKQDPSAKTKRGTLTGPDGYSDIDIQPDTHHVGAQGLRKVTFKEEISQGFPSPSNSPFKSKMHTASDEEDYSHLVINAAIQEVPNASKNVTSSNPDASEYSLAKVMPASTGKETPDDADAYNRIAITSNTADTQLQNTKNVHIENQDACSTLPAIATISNRDTERAAGEDPYDHIQANDYRHIVITSAKEEGAQASKNVASSNPNTSEYALSEVLPASTGKETPDDADAYNRIAITSTTADTQFQDTKNVHIENQDACSTLPAIATISNRDTERAAGEDPYDHIQADDYSHIAITLAKEEGAQASKNVASSNPNTSKYALAKVLPASTGKETPDDADAYNRIAITSNTADKQLQDTNNSDTGSTSAKEERPKASTNVASSNPDASEYSLAEVMPASTGKATPADADGYNRVAIDSDTADKQPQNVNIKDSDVENQDARGTLPATATPSRETESVAEEDPYNHINTVTY